MPGFTNVAVWGVNQILSARTEALAIETGQRCFPGMTGEHVKQIIADPVSVEFDEDGNTIVAIGGSTL